MKNPVEVKSSFNPLLSYVLAAAFIFTIGFLIHSGRQAHVSTSWQYVLSDADDLFYWSVAKGRMMTPRCDGNPYYFEEQGKRHIIPCTTSEVIGLLAKYSGFPLTWFIPAWQILMPICLWFFIMLCCWKLWNYPLGVSAAVTLILLLSTLFSSMFPLMFRARGMDGVILLFLWISLIFRGNPDKKSHLVAITLIAALALWVHPFLIGLGLWVSVMEYGYALLKKIELEKSRLYVCSLGSCFVSGLIYVCYAFWGKNTVSVLLANSDIPRPSLFYCFIPILYLVFVASVVIFFHKRLKKHVTQLDRLVIEWTSFGVLCYFAAFWMQAVRHVPAHMGYFFIIMAFSLLGWIHQKLCWLKDSPYFSTFNYILVILIVALLLFSAKTKSNYFSVVSPHYFVYVAQFFFVMLFCVLLLVRFNAVKHWVSQKTILWCVILLMAVVGYWKLPVYETLRNYPFDGGYRWLKEHSGKKDVVLTASLKFRLCEYLFLQTGLKSYFYVHGEGGTTSMTSYRRDFVTGLLLGLLDKLPGCEGWTLEKKLGFFKLDFILMPKPSPFFEAVTRQLRGHLLEVYQDSQCILWRVM